MSDIQPSKHDIGHLNKLFSNYKKAYRRLKSAMESAKESVQSSVLPFQKSCDIASAKFDLALKAFDKPVKFDRLNGSYFVAQGEDGNELFRLSVKWISQSCVEVSAKNEQDAICKVQSLIENNKVQESEYRCFVENISEKA